MLIQAIGSWAGGGIRMMLEDEPASTRAGSHATRAGRRVAAQCHHSIVPAQVAGHSLTTCTTIYIAHYIFDATRYSYQLVTLIEIGSI